jgi:hypothetical protein
MGKHTKYKAGEERSHLFPACRITETLHNRIEALLEQMPDHVKSKADLLAYLVIRYNGEETKMPAMSGKKEKDLLNYPHKQLELPVDQPEAERQTYKTRKAQAPAEPGTIKRLIINANLRGLDVNTVREYDITEAYYKKKVFKKGRFNLEIGQRYTALITGETSNKNIPGTAGIFLKEPKKTKQ